MKLVELNHCALIVVIAALATLTSCTKIENTVPRSDLKPAAKVEKQNEIEIPPNRSETCLKHIETIKSNYQYGWITVPERFSEAELKKINVFWYTKRKDGQQPLIFLNGGPMGEDYVSYSIYSNLEDKFNLGIVYMDQRGTGCSDKPRDIVDYETALEASYYGGEQIVHDAEALRKKFFGEKSQWILFGQSFGGWLAGRYLTMFPDSLRSVHTVSGTPINDFSDFAYYRIKSNLRQLKHFFVAFPEAEKEIRNFKELFTEQHCLNYKDRNICGFHLYFQIVESLLSVTRTWADLNELVLNKSGCPSCVFDAAKQLNPEFIKSFVEESEGGLNFFYNEQHHLKAISIWKQEAVMGKDFKDPSDACVDAYARLESEGLKKQDLLTDHCQIIMLAQNASFQEKAKLTLHKVKARNLVTPENVITALKSHPQIKYFGYTGEFDPGDTTETAYKLLAEALPEQVRYIHYDDADHWGYMDHSEVWQNMSGLNATIEDSKVTLSFEGKVRPFLAVRGSRTPALPIDSSIAASGIYVGFADQDFDEDLKSKIKGKVALISRGRVTFNDKVKRAVEAGAVGIVVGNNSQQVGSPFAMKIDFDVPIPTVMVSTKSFKEILKLNEEAKEIIKFNFSFDEVK